MKQNKRILPGLMAVALIVSTLFSTPSAYAATSIGIISGGSTEIANGSTFAIGSNNSDWYGMDVAGIGDINSDGVPDIVGGSLLDGVSGSDYGAAYITRLNSSGGAVGTTKITHGTSDGPLLANGNQYGSGVTGIGDINSDGVPDIAVGAPFKGKGSVFIHRLNSSGNIITSGTTEIADVTNGGPSLPSGAQFGSSVGDAGDINSDGVRDIVVGAPAENSGKGAFYVLFMNASGTVASSVRVTDGVSGGPSLTGGGNYGTGIAGLGDVNNDGVPDVAVGAYHDSANGSNSGAVYVHFMNSNGTVASSVKITGATANGPTGGSGQLLGNGVSAGGDVDKDGVEDLIAGSDSLQRLYVIFLNTNGTPRQTATISSSTTNGPTLGSDGYAIGVAGIGDINGDGVRDVAAGAFLDDTGGSDRGSVHIHRLSLTTDAPTTASISPTSKTAGDATFTVTVNGTNFTTDSTVRVDGSSRTTTFVSSTQLTASIPNTDIAAAGTKSITVNSPSGGTSNAQTLTVNNPAPTTTGISPTNKTEGQATFTLTVNGTGFNSASVVRLDGSARTTTYVSSTQLTASIPNTDIAAAGTRSITVFNGTPGGGTSNAQTLAVDPDVSTSLTSISPTSKNLNDASFVMTLNGANFTASSMARVNGTNRTTTYVSPTQLTAIIPFTDLTAAGTKSITVYDPVNGTSSAQTFTISQPVPVIATVSPTQKLAGAADFTLTVTGQNFSSGSVISFDGGSKATTYVSGSELTATITSADIATPGTYDVTVTNPSPGGGTSNTKTVEVDGNVSVSHTPSVPLTIDDVTLIGTVQYAPGLDRVEIYLDGTGPGDLVHTCELTAETSYTCSYDAGTLAYGSHVTTVKAIGNDTNESVGSETFHVSDYTTVNEVELSRLKTGEESEVTARYFLPTALSGLVTVTFPSGFSVLTAPTSGASSACLSGFGYSAGTRTIYATKTNCSGSIVLGGATVLNPSSAGVYQVTWVNDDPGGGPVYISDEDEISVTANVNPYVSFRVVATTSACSNGTDGVHDDTTPSGNGGTVALGTLSPLAVTSSDNASVAHVCSFVSTNADDGYALSVRSANGQLYSPTLGAGIPAAAQTGVAGTVTAQAGANSYGMCLLSTGGVGMDVSLPAGNNLSATSPYDSTCSGTSASQSMGALTTSANTIGSTTGPVQDGWSRWLLKASITSTVGAATDYGDTLTFITTATY